MGEFASKGVAGAGLGTGIAGLSLGVLNTIGGLGGLLGNRVGCGYGIGPMGYPVDLYQSELMAQKNAEIARLNAKVYSDESDLAIYKYFEGKIAALEEVYKEKCKIIWDWEYRTSMERVMDIKLKISYFKQIQ